MAAILSSAAVGLGAGVVAERSGYIEQALAALSDVLPANVVESLAPAASSARALVAGGLPGIAAVEGAAVVAVAKAAPLAAAAGAASASTSGRRKTGVVGALLALGAGATVHRVGVKGVQRAWRQARAARSRSALPAGAFPVLTIPFHRLLPPRRSRPPRWLRLRVPAPRACRWRRRAQSCLVRGSAARDAAPLAKPQFASN